MFEDIKCLEKVIMAADTSFRSEIVHLSAIKGTYEHLLIFNIALKAFFASNVLAWDLVRFSIDQVKDSIAEKAVEVRHHPRCDGCVSWGFHWWLLLFWNYLMRQSFLSCGRRSPQWPTASALACGLLLELL
jgi:hypothetical protein